MAFNGFTCAYINFDGPLVQKTSEFLILFPQVPSGLCYDLTLIFSAKLITGSPPLNILLTARLQGGDLLLFPKSGSLGSSVQGHDGLSCNKKIKNLYFKMNLFFAAPCCSVSLPANRLGTRKPWLLQGILSHTSDYKQQVGSVVRMPVAWMLRMGLSSDTQGFTCKSWWYPFWAPRPHSSFLGLIPLTVVVAQ